MPKKLYKNPENAPMKVAESAVTYRKTATPHATSSAGWNPNVPFHGTQEEWWEHFHRIEREDFTPLEEANREFEQWKKKFLANRLM